MHNFISLLAAFGAILLPATSSPLHRIPHARIHSEHKKSLILPRHACSAPAPSSLFEHEFLSASSNDVSPTGTAIIRIPAASTSVAEAPSSFSTLNQESASNSTPASPSISASQSLSAGSPPDLSIETNSNYNVQIDHPQEEPSQKALYTESFPVVNKSETNQFTSHPARLISSPSTQNSPQPTQITSQTEPTPTSSAQSSIATPEIPLATGAVGDTNRANSKADPGKGFQDYEQGGKNNGGKQSRSGDMTYYDPGSGSCGWFNNSSENIVAISTRVMKNPQNPNRNALCGKSITIQYKGKQNTAKIVDTCGSCKEGDIDLSPSLFKQVAPNGDGRVHGVEWWINE